MAGERRDCLISVNSSILKKIKNKKKSQILLLNQYWAPWLKELVSN